MLLVPLKLTTHPTSQERKRKLFLSVFYMQRKLWLHAVGGGILPLPRAALPFGCSCIVKPGRPQLRISLLQFNQLISRWRTTVEGLVQLPNKELVLELDSKFKWL